jgi:hypothetical protein
MATIKTQLVGSERRIITKSGRISCSCCEGEVEGCCMYPANQLGAGYAQDDLPSAVTIKWDGRFTGVLNKSGSGYADSGVTLQVVGGLWRLEDSEGTRSVGACLITGDGNYTPNNDLVEDQFADTYTVNHISTDTPIVMQRQSLCLWSGESPEGVAAYLVYGGDTLTSDYWGFGTPYKWSVLHANVGGFIGEGGLLPKGGNQNSPVGEYFGTGPNTGLEAEVYE